MKGNWIIRNLAGAAIFVLLLVVAISVVLSIGTKHNEEIPVPDFKELTFAEATKVAQANDVRLEIADSVFGKTLAPGAVYLQNPVAGTHVKKGRRIFLTLNTIIPQTIEMPDLVGFSLRQAKSVLTAKGLKVGKLVYMPDMATNNVLGQKYRGKDIRPGKSVETEAAIDLILGLNESDSTTIVPHLIGYTTDVAVSTIIDNSLNVGRLFYDESVKSAADSASAVVYRQEPSFKEILGENGHPTLKMGEAVTLYLTLDQSKIGK